MLEPLSVGYSAPLPAQGYLLTFTFQVLHTQHRHPWRRPRAVGKRRMSLSNVKAGASHGVWKGMSRGFFNSRGPIDKKAKDLSGPDGTTQREPRPFHTLMAGADLTYIASEEFRRFLP
jgi:hypothetical protein